MQVLQEAVELPGSVARYLLPWACAQAGRTAEAAERLRELGLDAASGLPSGYAVQWVAAAHASMGDMDEAFRLMERAVEERRFSTILLRIEHACALMRGDPRFQELLRRTRLD